VNTSALYPKLTPGEDVLTLATPSSPRSLKAKRTLEKISTRSLSSSDRELAELADTGVIAASVGATAAKSKHASKLLRRVEGNRTRWEPAQADPELLVAAAALALTARPKRKSSRCVATQK
jgi:hypothetical protein